MLPRHNYHLRHHLDHHNQHHLLHRYLRRFVVLRPLLLPPADVWCMFRNWKRSFGSFVEADTLVSCSRLVTHFGHCSQVRFRSHVGQGFRKFPLDLFQRLRFQLWSLGRPIRYPAKLWRKRSGVSSFLFEVSWKRAGGDLRAQHHLWLQVCLWFHQVCLMADLKYLSSPS